MQDVNQLYTAELAHCSVTEADLHIWVKVPLVSLTSDWVVVRYTPLPFVWGNQTCHLFPEPVIAARSGRTIIPLRGEPGRRCLASDTCQVPRDVLGDQTTRCIRAMTTVGSFNALLGLCAFFCSATVVPTVLALSLDEFVVANPTKDLLHVDCGDVAKSFANKGVAAHRLVVPPHCTAAVGDTPIVGQRVVVSNGTRSAASGEVLLPSLWSVHTAMDIHSTSEVAAPTSFSNISALLDTSWTRHTPHFMASVHHAVVTPPTLNDVPLKAYRLFPCEEFVLVGFLVALLAGLGYALWSVALLRARLALPTTELMPPATHDIAPPGQPTIEEDAVSALQNRTRRRPVSEAPEDSLAMVPLMARRARLSYPASSDTALPPALPLPPKPSRS